MKYLLDTHTLLWMDDNFRMISERVAALIQDENNQLFLSHVSIWEMQIKLAVGKLKLAKPLDKKIEEQRDKNGIQLLPIELPHIYKLSKLPLSDHRDPFDRLLIAQAIHERLPILSRDSDFIKYPIRVVW